MHNFNSFMRHAILALAMLCGSGHLFASPVYHVAIDTSTLAGQSGYLDFLFLGLANATPAHANVSNFSGNFDPLVTFTYGAPSGSVSTGVSVGIGDEFAQWAHFGQQLKFDVQFDLAPGAGAGSDLSIALLDNQFGYLGVMGNVMTFALQPGQPDQVTGSEIAQVNTNVVPEPSTLLQLASGCLILFGLRRRVRR
jgi:hypothetical protein